MNNRPSQKKFIFIYSDRHESYDLFKDLKGRNDVQLIVQRQKKINNTLIKKFRKIHLSGTIANHLKLPGKHFWFEKPEIIINDDTQYYIVVVDLVLGTLDLDNLKSLTARQNVKSALLLINSVSSNTIKQISKDIHKIEWDMILTFDEKDAERYGFQNAGYCYYSKHDEKELEEKYHKEKSDAYFIGTMKTSRKKEILSVYEVLKKSGAKIDFHLLTTANERFEDFPYKDEIDYFTSDRGLIPYDEILASVINTKTIVEILQEGQAGPSLRYYEAVCYNKKLLTNNPNIIFFPFYNENYMHIFEKPEDIDLDWLCQDNCVIEYCYKNEFSPTHLLEIITNLEG